MKESKRSVQATGAEPQSQVPPHAATDVSTVTVFTALPSDELHGRNDLYIILALLFAAFAVRIYSLQFFYVISTDGTSYALTGRAFANGDFHGIAVYGFYPVLIAVANFFIRDLETAGRVVSVISGSLLVVPLYLLGKSIFSRKIAVSAALIAIVWPSLVASSCEVMTQATYTTLQITSVLLLWRAFKTPSAIKGSIAGFFLGITFMTRPEGILLFIVLPLALLIFNFSELKSNRRLILFYLGSFLIPFLINLALVHHVTGEWQLSAKTDSALNDALSYYLNKADLTYVPGYEPKGYLDILREHPGFIWENSIKNLKALWSSIIPPLLWPFFAVGLFSGGFDRERNTVRLYLLSTFTAVLVLIVFYYISPGYLEAYMPVLFLFIAAGFTVFELKLKEWLITTLPEGKSALITPASLLVICAFIYAGTLLAPQIRKPVSDAEYWPHQDDGRRADKHIGKLLKENLPSGKIMTRWARIAFYAEKEWVNVPAGVSFEEIIRTAKEQSVRFFIADGSLYGMRPGLGRDIFQPLNDTNIPTGLHFNSNPNLRLKGLKPFLLYKNPRSIGVVVYEIPH